MQNSLNQELVSNPYEYKEQNPQYHGQPLDPSLANGPTNDRKCTDLLCCILFAVFWAALIFVAVIAFQKGNPKLLAAPFDSTGYQCGQSPGYQKFPYILFNQSNTKEFCCIDNCPTISNFSSSNCRFNNSAIPCQNFGIYNTTHIIDVCYPTNTSVMSGAIDLTMGDFQQGISDMQLCWPIELSVLFMAFIFAIFFMFVVKWCGACIVWTVIVGFFAVTAGFGGLCYYMAENPTFANQVTQNKELTNKTALTWMAIGLWTVDGIAFLVFLCLLKNINTAVAIIKATATFTEEQARTVLVPIVMFIMMAGFFCFWVAVSIYLFSSGTVTSCDGSPYGCIDWNTGVKRCLIFYLFGLFWNCQYAIALCQFVIASTASYWYFSHSQPTFKNESHICKSFWRGIFYHTGSLAFGALVILITMILQLFFELLHKCGKQGSLKNPEQNCCSKCCHGYVRCALACFERFMRFISKNAFVMMAIKGEGFCSSAHDAFYLIMRTKATYAIADSTCWLVIHFGKLLITIGCTVIGYVMIVNIDHFENQLYNPVAPTLVFFVVSWVVSSLFMDVFGIGSDTILLCYALQLDIHKGQAKSAPSHIVQFIGK